MLQLEATKNALSEDSSEVLISPEMAESLYEMASKRYDNGKYQDAWKCFHLLTLSYPDKAKYWFGLAASQQLLQQYQQAVLSFCISVGLDPANPYPLMHMAECFFSLKYIDEGLEILQKAQMLARNIPNAGSLNTQIEVLQMAWKPEK